MKRTAALILFLTILIPLSLRAGIPLHKPSIQLPLDTPSFHSGELLTYEFGWNDIPAADATVSVEQVNIEGEDFFLLKAWARTKGYVNWLWSMKDRVQALARTSNMESVHYRLEQDENGTKKTTTITFDHDKKIAHCVRAKKSRVKVKELEFNDAFDPITLAYYIRGLDLKVGDHKSFEAVMGKHIFRLDIYVEGIEVVRVAAGEFEALKLRPSVKKLTGNSNKGEHTHLKETYFWVSNDHRKILLQVKSQITFGYVYAELLNIQ